MLAYAHISSLAYLWLHTHTLCGALCPNATGRGALPLLHVSRSTFASRLPPLPLKCKKTTHGLQAIILYGLIPIPPRFENGNVVVFIIIVSFY